MSKQIDAVLNQMEELFTGAEPGPWEESEFRKLIAKLLNVIEKTPKMKHHDTQWRVLIDGYITFSSSSKRVAEKEYWGCKNGDYGELHHDIQFVRSTFYQETEVIYD